MAICEDNVTSIVNHLVYDSYGNLKSQTGAVDCLFGYTGRAFDEATGLQNNLNRWYDSKVGRWVSEDPIGFDGLDANLYRYVGNGVTYAVDSTGLKPPFEKSYNDDGTTTIKITGDNTIVVLYGHGDDKLLHKFEFKGNNTAGIFVGCFADLTNKTIPKEHRVPGMEGMTGSLASGFGEKLAEKNEQYDVWIEKAKKQARVLAEKIAKDTGKSVTIRGVFYGGWFEYKFGTETHYEWEEVIQPPKK